MTNHLNMVKKLSYDFYTFHFWRRA